MQYNQVIWNVTRNTTVVITTQRLSKTNTIHLIHCGRLLVCSLHWLNQPVAHNFASYTQSGNECAKTRMLALSISRNHKQFQWIQLLIFFNCFPLPLRDYKNALERVWWRKSIECLKLTFAAKQYVMTVANSACDRQCLALPARPC